jgi:hypothetical protein
MSDIEIFHQLTGEWCLMCWNDHNNHIAAPVLRGRREPQGMETVTVERSRAGSGREV